MRGSYNNKDGKQRREKGWKRPGLRPGTHATQRERVEKAYQEFLVERPEIAFIKPGDLVTTKYWSIREAPVIFIGFSMPHPGAFNQTPNAMLFGQFQLGYENQSEIHKLYTVPLRYIQLI